MITLTRYAPVERGFTTTTGLSSSSTSTSTSSPSGAKSPYLSCRL